MPSEYFYWLIGVKRPIISTNNKCSKQLFTSPNYITNMKNIDKLETMTMMFCLIGNVIRGGSRDFQAGVDLWVGEWTKNVSI